MSFSAEPFREMTVIDNADGTVSWQCLSCGGGWRDRFPTAITVAELRKSFNDHLTGPHRLVLPKES